MRLEKIFMIFFINSCDLNPFKYIINDNKYMYTHMYYNISKFRPSQTAVTILKFPVLSILCEKIIPNNVYTDV